MCQVHDWAEVHRLFHQEGWTKTTITDRCAAEMTSTSHLRGPPQTFLRQIWVCYAEEWITVKRSTVGEPTTTNTESLLRARVLPEFGGKRLKQITVANIRKWMAAMTEEGLAPPPSTPIPRVLGQILEQAGDDGLLVSNPAK